MSLSTEAKVGAVTVAGLLLLAFMMVQLGGVTFGEKGYPVQAVFGSVNGLKEGNLVRFAGVEVGKVEAVRVAPDGVRVIMMLNPGVKIPVGSKFTIGMDGLLGEKYIDIIPPQTSTGFIEPNAVVRGQDPQGIDQLVATADKVLADVHKLTQSLNEILGDEKVKQALRETAFNTREITANLNALSATLARMAKDNENDVNIMAKNLAAVSVNLKEVTARVDRLVANVDNNGETAKDLRDAIHNLKTTSSRVEKMAASLEAVITDPETSQNIRDTLRNAKAVSEKANKMLAKVERVSVESEAEVLFNTDSRKYQTNAGVRINTSPKDFVALGASSIGDNTKGNIQLGRTGGALTQRAGIVEGEPGIGVDAQVGKQMKLSIEAYDPNDVRVKLRSQFQVAPDTFIVGQSDSVNKGDERTTSIGVRRVF